MTTFFLNLVATSNVARLQRKRNANGLRQQCIEDDPILEAQQLETQRIRKRTISRFKTEK